MPAAPHRQLAHLLCCDWRLRLIALVHSMLGVLPPAAAGVARQGWLRGPTSCDLRAVRCSMLQDRYTWGTAFSDTPMDAPTAITCRACSWSREQDVVAMHQQEATKSTSCTGHTSKRPIDFIAWHLRCRAPMMFAVTCVEDTQHHRS